MRSPFAAVLSLGNCPLDPSLGSGKSRLRWAAGLRANGFSVDTLDSVALTQGMPRIGTRFRLALGALLKPKTANYDLVECAGGEFGWLARRLGPTSPRPLIVARTDGFELLNTHRAAQTGEKLSLKHKLTKPLHRRLDWWSFRYADAFVALCGTDVRFAQEQGLFKKTNAATINAGVDAEYLGIPFQAVKEHRVIYFGTWSQRKAPDRIVRVMSQVLGSDERATFEVLGASGAKAEIMAAFPEAQRGRITVHPKLPSSAVAATLLKAKVMFFPSHYEGFGMATSEAMGCSCAAVVTPTGFGADLRDGEDALVRDFDDEAGMVRNILALLSDDALRVKISRAGWERVQQLSWENQGRQLAETYAHWLDAWDASAGRFKAGFVQ